MNRPLLVISFLIFVLSSCQTGEKEKYLRWVGDLERNTEIDNPSFNSCNGDENILQYFNLGEGPKYVGDKTTLLDIFKTEYKPISDESQSGLIRIRFIVNCKGKAGRFRTLGSDFAYKEFSFNKNIVSQLIEITTGIENWEIFYRNEIPVDYYFYLIFKISDGHLTEILP